MKVIVTAIRSIRDYWIHSSIHQAVPTVILRFVFSLLLRHLPYLMWHTISSHINHIPHIIIMIFVYFAHWIATPFAHFNNCFPPKKRGWEDIFLCSKERNPEVRICTYYIFDWGNTLPNIYHDSATLIAFSLMKFCGFRFLFSLTYYNIIYLRLSGFFVYPVRLVLMKVLGNMCIMKFLFKSLSNSMTIY